MHLFKFNFAPESHAVEFKDFKRKFKVISSSNQEWYYLQRQGFLVERGKSFGYWKRQSLWWGIKKPFISLQFRMALMTPSITRGEMQSLSLTPFSIGKPSEIIYHFFLSMAIKLHHNLNSKYFLWKNQQQAPLLDFFVGDNKGASPLQTKGPYLTQRTLFLNFEFNSVSIYKRWSFTESTFNKHHLFTPLVSCSCSSNL